MMHDFDKELFVVPEPKIFNKKMKHYDDNIFTWDIETVSLFEIDGEYQPFDYSKDAKFYKDVNKAAVPYIWMFGCNDVVWYGREFMDFEKVLKAISMPDIRRFVIVHNLSYEMQFMLDIVQKNNWHIVEMCARNLRQPIQFTIQELNITFRCSYMLTNLSLEKAAEKYTDVRKAVGDLDYNVNYSPSSELPELALYYCEMDIVTLYKVMCYFVDKYEHLCSVPLTQTGEVRSALRDYIDYWYIKSMWALVPPEHMYCTLMLAFQGGLTHGNALNCNQIFSNRTDVKYDHNECDGIWSYDFASSYPYVMCAYKMPSEAFFTISESEIPKFKDKYCLIYDVTLRNVRAKKHNHYLSYSKLLEVDHGSLGDYKRILDNGRVVQLKSCRFYGTNYDMECLRIGYDFELEINHVWASYAKRLDKRVINFILDRYVAKTELKHIDEDDPRYDYYRKCKGEINSCYGMCVTNALKSGIEYDVNQGWFGHEFQEYVDDGHGGRIKFIDKKIAEMKKSYSTLFFYGTGVFVTSIARWNLYRCICGIEGDDGKTLDDDVIYYDTDSIKGIGDRVKSVVDKYNNEVLERLYEASNDLEIDIKRFMPDDVNGVSHPMGVFDNETKKGLYQEFITMGAKKYCYRKADGSLHMTVSGVRKKAVAALNDDISNFKKGLVFGYHDAEKLIHYYDDNQPEFDYRDIDGNIYHSKQRHSIILQPTTYTLGITAEFEDFIRGEFNDQIMPI